MNLFKSRTDAKHQEMAEASTHPHYLLHKDEPVDFYRNYKDSDFLPLKGGRNLQNLFDDSDVKLNHWFIIARKYLSKY